MKKTNKTNTITKQKAKTCQPPIRTFKQEYYLDLFSFKMHPVSNDYLIKFALEWVNWVCNNEDVLTVNEYFICKGVHARTVWNWKQRCAELKEAHAFVLQVLGTRREKGALTRKYDSNMVRLTMSLYDSKWKELEEWQAQLRTKETQAINGIRVVEIERFPNSDLVPLRKIENTDF